MAMNGSFNTAGSFKTDFWKFASQHPFITSSIISTLSYNLINGIVGICKGNSTVNVDVGETVNTIQDNFDHVKNALEILSKNVAQQEKRIEALETQFHTMDDEFDAFEKRLNELAGNSEETIIDAETV